MFTLGPKWMQIGALNRVVLILAVCFTQSGRTHTNTEAVVILTKKFLISHLNLGANYHNLDELYHAHINIRVSLSGDGKR
jgi:hypothetical protein